MLSSSGALSLWGKQINAGLRIPVLLNTKTLTRGDVLRVFAKKTTQKREEKAVPISITQVAKKAKIAVVA